ncbi:hypothetical protein ACP70R_005085 [Stipagrostis hirtigluma subsp. patula]
MANHAAAGAWCSGDHRTSTARPQHLYLVLDDTRYGFGTHKVAIDDDEDDKLNGDVVAEKADSGTLECLPEPPLMRIEYPTLGGHPSFFVLGSNIIGLGYAGRPSDEDERRDGFTLAVLRAFPNCAVVTAVAAGNRLYMIESSSSVEGYGDEYR